MYTTIIHQIRKMFSLSMNEYAVLDCIYKLSCKKLWCTASQKTIGDLLDLSDKTIRTIYFTLEAKQLIEKRKKEKTDTGVRPTNTWIAIMTSGEWLTAVKIGNETIISGKLNRLPTEVSSLPTEVSSYNTNSNTLNSVLRNTELGTDVPSVSENSNQEEQIQNPPIGSLDSKPQEIPPAPLPSPPKQYGNEDINKILAFLKKHIGIDTFAESDKEQRRFAQHLKRLSEKIGKKEFIYRFKAILEDDFKRKNCNKIKYLYKELKSFIKTENET